MPINPSDLSDLSDISAQTVSGILQAPDLISAIRYLNALRITDNRSGKGETAERVFDLLFSANQTLAVYGSLMPGKENHHIVSDIEGTWETGIVYGHFHDGGWGAGMGYPSMIWDPGGREIPVHVLISSDLPRHWNRLDRFEGSGYHRILVPVYRSGDVQWIANIYQSATNIDG